MVLVNAQSSPAKRGPRADRGQMKETILDAAQTVFAHQGFAAATMQAIAKTAGVDKKLVHYYFQTKDELFFAMVERVFHAFQARETLRVALTGDPTKALSTYVERVLTMYEDPDRGETFIALLRSLGTYQPATDAFMRFISSNFFPLAQEVNQPDAELRMALMGSQIYGFLVARYIIAVPPISDLTIPEATAILAPRLAHTLTTTP